MNEAKVEANDGVDVVLVVGKVELNVLLDDHPVPVSLPVAFTSTHVLEPVTCELFCIIASLSESAVRRSGREGGQGGTRLEREATILPRC